MRALRAHLDATGRYAPAHEDVGRIAAELISPYPPGVPVVAPHEVTTREVVDYLTSGVAAGMLVPDASDSGTETFRVTARQRVGAGCVRRALTVRPSARGR